VILKKSETSETEWNLGDFEENWNKWNWM